MKIVHFLRPAGTGNYSIEGTFAAVRRSAGTQGVPIELVQLPYANTGIVPRIRNGVYAWRRRGDVNHVLGDVHYLVLFLPRRTTLLTIHDCIFAYHRNPIKRLFLRLFWLHVPVQLAAVVTTISGKSRREILDLTRAPKAGVVVVPDCVADTFTYVPKEADSHVIRILQIGTRINKNVVRLVQALEGLDVFLEVVGPLDPRLLSVLESSCVPYENRRDLTELDMVAAYVRCDIVAFVSTYEGFGMPIVEGQAVGRVVVTSDMEPMRSVAGDGAEFVDPESVSSIRAGIERVIGDAAYREALIGRGLENARKYRAEAIAAQYLRLYAELGPSV